LAREAARAWSSRRISASVRLFFATVTSDFSARPFGEFFHVLDPFHLGAFGVRVNDFVVGRESFRRRLFKDAGRPNTKARRSAARI
jgi:hypothetical protein